MAPVFAVVARVTEALIVCKDLELSAQLWRHQGDTNSNLLSSYASLFATQKTAYEGSLQGDRGLTVMIFGLLRAASTIAVIGIYIIATIMPKWSSDEVEALLP